MTVRNIYLVRIHNSTLRQKAYLRVGQYSDSSHSMKFSVSAIPWHLVLGFQKNLTNTRCQLSKHPRMLSSPISKTVEASYLKRKLKTRKLCEQRKHCIGSVKLDLTSKLVLLWATVVDQLNCKSLSYPQVLYDQFSWKAHHWREIFQVGGRKQSIHLWAHCY